MIRPHTYPTFQAGCTRIASILGILLLSTTSFAEPAEAPAREACAAAAKAVFQDYIKGYFCPATNLVYGTRLDRPKGLAVFETPENVAQEKVKGKYRPYGYGAGFEDTAYQTGTCLFALCDAYDATGDKYFAEQARTLFKGMKLIGTLSPVPGFIVRGPHPDGKSYYRDSSLDQHSLYVCGLWRYYRSPIASDDEKAFIRKSLDQVATRLETNKWSCLVEDNSRVGHAGGGNWAAKSSHASVLLLSLLAATRDVAGGRWVDVYNQYANEDDGIRWRKISEGFHKTQPRYTFFNNQNAFRANTLLRIETDPARKAAVKKMLAEMATDMLSADFLTCWRRLDWIDKRPEEDVNAFLAPLGLNTQSNVTLLDLWQRYRDDLEPARLPSDGKIRFPMKICLMPQFMTWQIALLADEPALAAQVRPRLLEMRKKVDFAKLNSGFVANYAVIYALLAVPGK